MKKKKALKALLVAFAATCVCAGFSACGKKDDGSQPNSEIYAIYQSYVAHAEANGEDVLSYEDWLASIKGEKGEKGEAGRGIVSISLAEDRKSYIVKYSDGSSESIPVPEALPEQEHDHEWGEIVRLVEPSVSVGSSGSISKVDGFGYKECSKDGCGARKIVILKDFSGSMSSSAVYRLKFIVGAEEGVKSADDISVSLPSGAYSFKIKSLDANVQIAEGESNPVGLFEKAVGSEDPVVSLKFQLDCDNVSSVGVYECDIDVEIESLEIGAEKNPVNISVNSLIQHEAAADEWVYFRVGSSSDPDSLPKHPVLHFGDNVSAELVGHMERVENESTGEYFNSYVPLKAPEKLESGKPAASVFSSYSTTQILYRVKASDGNIAFKLAHAAGEDSSSAEEIQVKASENEEAYKGVSAIGEKYFRFTAAKSEKVVFYRKEVIASEAGYGGGASVSYTDVSIIKPNGSSIDINGKYTVFEVVAGQSYIIDISSITEADGYEFKLFSLGEDESIYEGYAEESAIDISGESSYEVSDGAGNRYFKYVVPQKGRFSLGFENEEFIGRIMISIDDDFAYYSYPDEKYKEQLLPAGTVVNIAVSTVSSSYKLKIDYYQIVEVENTIQLVNAGGKALALKDITVKVWDDDAFEVIAQGVTDEKGIAKISFVPGNYSIMLSGLDENAYQYNGDGYTELPLDSAIYDKGETVYEVMVLEYISKSFVVKSGEQVISGAKVKLMQNGEEVKSGESGEDGKVLLENFLDGNYDIEIDGLSDSYIYLGSKLEIGNSQAEIELQVSDAVIYSISFEGDDLPSEGAVVKLIGAEGKVFGSGAVGADGKASVKSIAGVYSIEIEGFVVSGETSESEFSVAVPVEKIHNVAGGKTSSPAKIDLGYYIVSKNGSSGKFVYFSAPKSGVYKFEVLSENAFASYYYYTNGASPSTASSDVKVETEKDGKAIVISIQLSKGKEFGFNFNDSKTMSYPVLLHAVLVKEVEEEEKPTDPNALQIGSNVVAVDESEEGVSKTFTATEAGSYKLMCTDSLWGCLLEDETEVTLPIYTFTLEAGESITFIFFGLSVGNVTVTIVKA